MVDGDVLASIMLGHLVGDYIFQNDWMALNKSKKNSLGRLACFVHCTIYSACVCIYTVLDPVWFCLVFLSHYPIDRMALADDWNEVKGNTRLSKWMTSSTKGLGWARTEQVSSAFQAIIYVVQDNTMHLMLMWMFWKMFMK